MSDAIDMPVVIDRGGKTVLKLVPVFYELSTPVGHLFWQLLDVVTIKEVNFLLRTCNFGILPPVVKSRCEGIVAGTWSRRFKLKLAY